MENASKALVMAGGMLIALLVIGALVLMFNQIGDYEKGQHGIKKTTYIVEFNRDFERYLDDNEIIGADVISLINKVIDYNNKAKNGAVNNSIDSNIRMSITISDNMGRVKYVFNEDSVVNLNELIEDSEFKASIFVLNKETVYEKGQIKDIYLKLK